MTTRSSPRDFDFLMGRWRVRHRRLAVRLAGSNEWQLFEGNCEARPILGGQGNVDDNVLHGPAGTYHAATIRTFDPGPGQWAIWWLDSRYPDNLGSPVVGRFEEGIGSFLSDDLVDGRRMLTRFLWTRTDTPSPRWEQALSVDGGASWETNWSMEFIRDG